MKKVYDNRSAKLIIRPTVDRVPRGTVRTPIFRAMGKRIAYSQHIRSLSQKIIRSSLRDVVYASIRRIPILYSPIRKISHPALPKGLHYAKLFIYGWQVVDGKRFRLMYGDECVYGTTIEPPQKGFELEYRNIVVTSTAYEDFHLEIDDPDEGVTPDEIEFRLVFSETQFSTKQQDEYDLKYGVQLRDGVYYSLRGNLKNPKKLVVTFPGFGSSTARVSYAVSFLGALDENDLKDACLIALQDRYGVSGTFMVYDDAGNLLHENIEKVIKFYVNRFGIEEKNILFFGGSKGATCALYHIAPYKEAILIAGTSAMNLPHRMRANPFFRDNLGNRAELRDISQPFDLLSQYIQEKRTLHWFHSLDDEIANISMIDLLEPSEGLSLYRVSGAHPQVIIKSMATMLSYIRDFLNEDTTDEARKARAQEIVYNQADKQIEHTLDVHPLDKSIQGSHFSLLFGLTKDMLNRVTTTYFIDQLITYIGSGVLQIQVVLNSQFPLWPKKYSQINMYLVRPTDSGAEYISLNAHKHSSNIFFLPEQNALLNVDAQHWMDIYTHILCVLNNGETFVQEVSSIERTLTRSLSRVERPYVHMPDGALLERYPHTLFSQATLGKVYGYTVWHNTCKEHLLYAHTCTLGNWEQPLSAHVYYSHTALLQALELDVNTTNEQVLFVATSYDEWLAPTLIHRFINEFGVSTCRVFIHGQISPAFEAYNERMDDEEEKGMSWSVPMVMYEDV